MNILLQSLFMNRHFRDSLWQFESSDAEVRRKWETAIREGAESMKSSSSSGSALLRDQLPYHLLSIFTELSFSRRSFVDPLSLINQLGISHTDQQDAHEFRTYLMQALEDALAASTFPTHRTLLQTLFEGESTSVLRCMACKQQSRTRLPFVDLGVPIKGRASVYAGLQSLVEEEELEENAVYCSHCRTKRSMSKHVEYPQLPPYLNLQLMRFELVWHGNAVRKKKIGEKIYIPEKINMRTCLAHITPHTPHNAEQQPPPPPPPDSLHPLDAQTTMEEKQPSEGVALPPLTAPILPRLTSSPASPSSELSLLPPIPMSPDLSLNDEELNNLQQQQAQALEQKTGSGERTEEPTAAQLARKGRKRKKPSIGRPKRKPPRVRASSARQPQQQREEEDAEDALEEEDVSEFIPEPPPQPPAQRKGSRARSRKKKPTGDGEAIDLTSSSTASSSVASSSTSAPSPAPAGPPPPSCYSAEDDVDDYHLMAVLLHKGQFANHGHYTATLRDDQGCWWSFDDRVVKRLGDNFYHKGGEVVLDAAEEAKEEEKKEGREEEEQQPQPSDREEKAERGKHEEETKDSGVEDVVMEPSPLASAAAELTAGRPKRTPRASSKRGRPSKTPTLLAEEKEAPASDVAEAKEKAAGSKKGPGSHPKGKGKGKAKADSSKSSASKLKRSPSDGSGVDAKTKAEAERMYGPGGYSKDAYMLLYVAHRHHPKLRQLEQQHAAALRVREESEVSSGVEPHEPTFAVLQAHLPFASAFISRHRRALIERENREFELSKVVYAEKRRQVTEAVDARKAEVEAAVPHLQAEAIDLQQVREELRLSVDESAEALEGDRPSRFISADWLATFLTGWPVEVEAKRKMKEKEPEQAKEEAAASTSTSTSTASIPEKAAKGSSADAIDISTDSDDASGDASGGSSPTQAKAEDGVDDSKAQSGDEEEKEEDVQALQDRSHLVVDHDVHVSLAGMDEAVRTALRHLQPGPLSDAINHIRCPKHPQKLSPHCLSQVKRISKVGWDQLTRLLSLTAPILPHGSLDVHRNADIAAPASPADVDVIPSSQLEELGMVNDLSLTDLCLVCARDLFLGDVQRARDVKVDRQLLADYAVYRAAHKTYDRYGKSIDPKALRLPDDAVWVDKEWIGRWKKHVQAVVHSSKSAKDVAQQAALTEKLKQLREEAPPLGDLTAGLLCPHNELDIDFTRRVYVSRELWDRLLKAGDPDSALLSVTTPDCPLCRLQGQSEDEEYKRHMQSMKDEKVALRHWSTRDFPFPHPQYPPEQNSTRHPHYFLLPFPFHSQVAAFIRSHDPADTRPHLDLSPLLCQHRQLRYQTRPEWEVGEHGLRGTPQGLLAYCDESVWATFKRFGYVDEDEMGIRMTCKKAPGLSHAKALQPWEAISVETEPSVCVECAMERQRAEEADQLRFTREDGGGITVLTVNSEEEARNSLPLTSSTMSPAVFHSTPSPSAPSTSVSSASLALPTTALPGRPRRHAGRRGGGAPAVHQLLCSSSKSILSIKMELMQSLQLDCPPNRQQLWYRGQKMDGDKRLEDYGVMRGGEVRLLLLQEDGVEDFDAAATEAESSGRKGKAAAERGFQGTALGWHARQLVHSGQPAAAAATATTTTSTATTAANAGSTTSTEEDGTGSLLEPPASGVHPDSPVNLVSPAKTEKMRRQPKHIGETKDDAERSGAE